MIATAIGDASKNAASPRPSGRAARALYWAVCIALTLVVFFVFLRVPGINGYRGAMFSDMVYGRADKPYVFHAFIPAATRLLSSAIPDKTKQMMLQRVAAKPIVPRVLRRFQWEPQYLIEYAIACALMYASLWGFLFSLRYLCTALFRAPGAFADAVPLLALIGLPACFRYHSYLSDFPALFLFSLGIGLMLARRWRLLLLLLLPATLNASSAILLVLVFAIHFGRPGKMDRAHYLRLLLLQLAVVAGTEICLLWAFRDNPGTILELHADHNLRLVSTYSLSTLVVWSIIAIGICYRWSEKPQLLRDTLWIVPPVLVIALLFGYVDELRVYYEAYPAVLLLLAHTLAITVGAPIRAIDGTAQPARGPRPTSAG